MGRRSQLPPPWDRLTNYCGGSKNLVAVLGVDYATVYRWAHGQCSPHEGHRDRLRDLCTKAGVSISAALREPAR